MRPRDEWRRLWRHKNKRLDRGTGNLRPRDKYDDMFEARVVTGQIPGDAELRRQKRERHQ
jgi:hypothetical protein